jgi:hypothetical protein
VTGRFVNKRILSWCLGDGPELVQLVQDYEFVKSRRNGSGHEFVVPIAGRLLEHALQELRYTLELAVPARPEDRYTIMDLWPKFQNTVKKEYRQLWDEVAAVCQQLNDTVVIRNWQTHSNEWARELSRSEAMEFISAVLCIFEKVYCQSCSSFVRVCEAPQGGVSCKKGCLRYLPASGAQNESGAGHVEESSGESGVAP